MKRRTSTATVKVYTYGVAGELVADEGAAQVRTTLEAAHTYRNKLTEIERERRQAIRDAQLSLEALAPLHEALLAEDAALEALYAELRAARADQRTRKVPAELRSAIALAKERKGKAAAALKEAKMRAEDKLKPLYAEIEKQASEKLRAARAASNVYHPTYQLVEAAHAASRNATAKKLAPEDDPRFRRAPRAYGGRVDFPAEGRIAVVTGGRRVTVQEAFSGTHSWLRISPIDPSVYYLPQGERRRSGKMRARVSFRVGSTEDRKPIWASFTDVILHRELPANGTITMAWFRLKMLGDRPSDMKWELQLSVEAPEQEVASASRGTGVVALNVGWRMREQYDGRRVAYLVDDAGHEREIVYSPMPRSRAGFDGDRFEHSDGLRAVRGKHFNAAHAQLVAYVASLEGEKPAFLEEVSAHLAQWRSSSRLAALVRAWVRHEGDEEIHAELARWLHQDRHLYQWEVRQTSRAIGNRKHFYRDMAHDICSRYETVVLGELDLRKLAKKAAPEASEEDATNAQRRARSRTAPSEFLAALKLVAANTGVVIVRESALNITRACHVCGHTEAWDARANLEHKCSGCGSVWDQDANACRNLLRRYRERLDADETPEGARDAVESDTCADSATAEPAR